MLAAVAAAYTALMLCSGHGIDDWIYMFGSGSNFYEFWHCTGEPIRTASQAWESTVYHYMTSNGRLADKLLIFTNLMPMWVCKLGIGLAWGVATWALARLSLGPGWARRPLGTALLLWAIFLVCVWDHFFVSSAVGLNYVVSAALVLPVVILFLGGGKSDGPAAKAAIILLAFAAGFMHEGYSLPVLGAMGVYWLMHRRLTARQWLVSLPFIAGTAVLMAAPGTGVRMDDAGWGIFSWYFTSHILYIMPALWLLGAAGVALLIFRFKKGARSGGALFFVVAGFLGVLVGLIAQVTERAYWFPSWLLVIAVFRMLTPYVPHRSGMMGRIAGLALGAALTGWLCWAAALQHRYTRETDMVERRVRATASPLLFADVSNFMQTPPALMALPHPVMSRVYFNMVAIRLALFDDKAPIGKGIVILPRRLEGVPASQWPRLGENAYGVFPFYYIKGMNPAELPGATWVEFDLEGAPLTVWNASSLLRGRTRIGIPVNQCHTWIDPKILPPAQRAQFADPATGEVPDTLTFIYLSPLPRAVIPSRVTAVRL